MGEFQQGAERAFGKRWLRVGSVVAALVAVWLIAGLVFGMWPFSAAAGVAKRTVNAASIIQNYQWFYDQKNAIDAQRANLRAVGKEAAEYKGMLMVLNNAIAEYNSRSRQVNRSMWKAPDLPYQIELEVAP